MALWNDPTFWGWMTMLFYALHYPLTSIGHGLNDSQDTKTAVKFIILTNLQNSTFMLQPRPWVGILSQMT